MIETMRIYTDLADIEPITDSIALTIGTFDGLHRGHAAVLEALANIGREKNCALLVVTFSNHPRSVLDPEFSPQYLCTPSHKRALLRQFAINYLLDLPFTHEFSQQTAEELLRSVRNKFPFEHVVLGHDAHFGKDRSGNPDTVKSLAKKLQFGVTYVDAIRSEDAPISSSRIRELLREGKLQDASSLLGRPYSIQGPVVTGKGMGTVTGYRTANLDVTQLCLPPFGVYHVTLHYRDLALEGIANLGLAPSVEGGSPARLEVHLFNYEEPLYRQEVEVVLHEFLRPERKFDTLDQLKNQIRDDIARIARKVTK